MLALLKPVVAAQKPDHSNLLGFEWLELEGVIAGRLVTEPTPAIAEDVTSWTSVQLAQYCMLAHVSDLHRLEATEDRVRLAVLGESRARIADVGPSPTPGMLQVNIQLVRQVDPIHVLVIGGRAIAIGGLGKLTRLAAAKAPVALCMVSYGYGTAALKRMKQSPTLSMDVLGAPRPPLVTDFVDESLAIEFQSPLPTTILSFQTESITLTNG